MRVAVEDLDATFVGLGRALVAAVLAGALLAIRREPLPDRRDLPRFAIVGLGVVIGFPLLSALALQHLTSAHTSVVVGLLPAATAVWAVSRAGERPPLVFWAAVVAGVIAVLAFAATQGVSGIAGADLLVLGGGRARRARLRRGRRALAPLRRHAGDLLGAAAHGAVPRPPRRALDARRPARGRRGVARLRVRRRRLDVPRLLRLVPRPGARRRREDRPDPARAAGAHARVVRAAARRGGHGRDGRRRARRARLRRRDATRRATSARLSRR